MQFTQIQRILGILLMLFSSSMLPAVAVGFYYGEQAREAFMVGFLITMVAGFLSGFRPAINAMSCVPAMAT